MNLAEAAQKPIIVWFRNDLRVRDNLALCADADAPVICVYIYDNKSQLRPLGGAQRWWLHHSLIALDKSLAALGSRLVLRRGAAQATLSDLIAETGADTVVWNRRYDPAGIAVDMEIKSELKSQGIAVQSFDGQLLHEPTRIKTGGGTPFKVYTPFWRALNAGPEPREPIAAPLKLNDGSARLVSERLEDWNLLPIHPNWAGGMQNEWTPGEIGAHERLEVFLDGPVRGYADDRNIPGEASTSKLSPHLAFGEITPFQIWHASSSVKDAPSRDVEVFRKEVAWREFAHHLLFFFPKLATKNFNASFDTFPWGATDPVKLKAWQTGQTGYPIVDAGMRELWQTGWMHNRVRMIVASFLIKHLMIDWREGERWFWDTLVDACPANNAASWQWVAGSGADAAPYYRIFNPILQGEKFDPDGVYVKRYVPELANVPLKYLHHPWDAPRDVLDAAGVSLGAHYPKPIVDHFMARDRALDAYKETRGAA